MSDSLPHYGHCWREGQYNALKSQREIHDCLINSQWRSIPTGSHSTQLDVPDIVNLYAEEFLKESL